MVVLVVIVIVEIDIPRATTGTPRILVNDVVVRTANAIIVVDV